jgi:hypothetical protein
MDLPSCLFSSGFSTKILYTLLLSPIRATCPANLILLDFRYCKTDVDTQICWCWGFWPYGPMIREHRTVDIVTSREIIWNGKLFLVISIPPEGTKGVDYSLWRRIGLMYYGSRWKYIPNVENNTCGN